MSHHINYKWASLGTGVIANELAQALEKRLVGNSIPLPIEPTIKVSLRFEKYGIEKVYHEIDEVFEGSRSGYHLYLNTSQYSYPVSS